MLKTQLQKSLATKFCSKNQEIQPYNVFLIFPEINLEQATPARLSKIKL